MKHFEVIICGAGISGLATAFWLQNKGLASGNMLILESSERCGGNIETRRIDGNLLEMGPNSIMLKSTRVLDFLNQANMLSSILTPELESRRRFLRRGDRLWSISVPRIISKLDAHSALRLTALTLSSAGPQKRAESVYNFFCRKIGPRLTNELVVPFVSGIYAGDSRQLLIKQAFPHLAKLESRFNSIPLGYLLNPAAPDNLSGPHRGLISFNDGLQSLTDRLSSILQNSLRLSHRVTAINKIDTHHYTVETPRGKYATKNLVISMPSFKVADILEGSEFNYLRNLLKCLDYPFLRVMHFKSPKLSSKIHSRGFGFLSQQYEPSAILGCLWPSHCFKDRCPDEMEIHTIFSGGKLYPQFRESEIESHTKIVEDELSTILGMSDPSKLIAYRDWPQAIPQYDYRQAELHQHLREKRYELTGLYFNSNFYQGVSIGDCILNGMNTAEGILSVQK